MNVEKLKITALKHEKREDWRKAIDVYLKVIEAFESGAAISHDLSVYNRVGDLYMKVKQTSSAVQSYERAVDLYADQGMTNQAIALCGKVLRVNPGRVQTYLKLARLHAEKNVVVDARKNLLEYLERMNALGNRDDALEEVKAFADRFGRNEDIRAMLSALVRALSRDTEAQEQLEELADQLESRGDAEGVRGTREQVEGIDSDGPSQGSESPGGGLIFLDTGTGLRAPAPIEKTPVGTSSSAMEPPAVEDAPSVDLEVDRGRYEEDTEELEIESVGDLESTSLEVDEASAVPPIDGLLVDSASELSAESAGSVDELDVTIEHTLGDEDALSLEVEPDEDADAESEEEAELDLPAELAMVEELDEADVDQAGVEVAEVEVEEAEVEVEEAEVEVEVEEAEVEVEEAEVEVEEAEVEEAEVQGVEKVEEEVEEAEVEKTPLTASDIPPGPLGFLKTEEPVGPTVEELEDRILDDPDDPAAHRTLGEVLIADGDLERGTEELELALQQYEREQDWGRASDILTELLRLEPNRIAFYQKRVELAFRSGEKFRLVQAYLALGDVLVRVGAMQKAVAVYGRVLEHDPENALALAALQSLEPAADAPQGPVVSPAAAQASSDFVDLNDMVLETKKPKDARIRIKRTQPTGDESHDFAEILQHFKQGIEETIGAEDYQSHYDLGVAFKEMGLLDEAIAEFQKALR
ncbi:MAG: hypothetical protein V3R89_02340, partial [Thermoanaerobaculia bacterium]